MQRIAWNHAGSRLHVFWDSCSVSIRRPEIRRSSRKSAFLLLGRRLFEKILPRARRFCPKLFIAIGECDKTRFSVLKKTQHLRKFVVERISAPPAFYLLRSFDTLNPFGSYFFTGKEKYEVSRSMPELYRLSSVGLLPIRGENSSSVPFDGETAFGFRLINFGSANFEGTIYIRCHASDAVPSKSCDALKR